MRFYAYVVAFGILGTVIGGTMGSWGWFSLLVGGLVGATIGFMFGFAKGADKR